METLLILGASARAAAFSARRAGFGFCAGDLFADMDLRRAGPVTRVEDYPGGLAAVAAAARCGPWIYTGGLESHPALVDSIAGTRPLWGNPGRVLREVRDPLRLAEEFGRHGIPFPRVSPDARGVPDDGSWLSKPLRGSGGIGIRPWRGRESFSVSASNDFELSTGIMAETERDSRPPPGRYFQERIPGVPCGAVYVGAAGSAVLLGVTRQLVGEAWTGAGGFRYCGSMGPLEIGPAITRFERIGRVLSGSFGLSGLFGVDAILNGDTVWPIEVNPRYTASIEVLERATGVQAVRLHAEACLGQRLPSRSPAARKTCCGKAIVYARADAIIGRRFAEFAEREMAASGWPRLADIPEAGTAIRAGMPVTTVFAEGRDEAEVLAGLQDLAGKVSGTFLTPFPSVPRVGW